MVMISLSRACHIATWSRVTERLKIVIASLYLSDETGRSRLKIRCARCNDIGEKTENEKSEVNGERSHLKSVGSTDRDIACTGMHDTILTATDSESHDDSRALKAAIHAGI